MRTSPFAILAIATLLLTGCSNDEQSTDTVQPATSQDIQSELVVDAPTNPRFTIDMSKDMWLRGVTELVESDAVVIRNFKEGETVELYGHGFDVYVEGNLPPGSTVSIMGPAVTVYVTGNIAQSANLTIQGDTPHVVVAGDIHVMSIINLYGAEPKLTMNGRPADENLLDSHIASNPENTTEAHR